MRTLISQWSALSVQEKKFSTRVVEVLKQVRTRLAKAARLTLENENVSEMQVRSTEKNSNLLFRSNVRPLRTTIGVENSQPPARGTISLWKISKCALLIISLKISNFQKKRRSNVYI